MPVSQLMSARTGGPEGTVTSTAGQRGKELLVTTTNV